MNTQEIFDVLKKQFGDSVIEKGAGESCDEWIVVDSKDILDISLFLRDADELQFDYLDLLSGMDYGKNLAVVYHLYSMNKKHKVTIKTLLNRENPTISTTERVWRASDWHEREAYDMYGIVFEGHHNLIRILCPYDWEGFPLRKDYVYPQEYHGMKVPY
jgi:NADH-quinone oxidoreductase subunit C